MKGTSADGLFLEFWKLNKRRGLLGRMKSSYV